MKSLSWPSSIIVCLLRCRIRSIAPRTQQSPTTASVIPTPMPALAPGAKPLVLGAMVGSKPVGDVDNKLVDRCTDDGLVDAGVNDRLVDGGVNGKLVNGDVVGAKI